MWDLVHRNKNRVRAKTASRLVLLKLLQSKLEWVFSNPGNLRGFQELVS